MLGGRICTTASASASSASIEASTRAPPARYSSSEANARDPAPASTETSIFFARSRLTESGTIATRRSPAPSFRTAILMVRAHSRLRCARGSRRHLEKGSRALPPFDDLAQPGVLAVVEQPDGHGRQPIRPSEVARGLPHVARLHAHEVRDVLLRG